MPFLPRSGEYCNDDRHGLVGYRASPPPYNLPEHLGHVARSQLANPASYALAPAKSDPVSLDTGLTTMTVTKEAGPWERSDGR
jgi:hypothetical protein